MSKRPQVLLPDENMADIQRLGTLGQVRESRSMVDPESKLRAVRTAVGYAFLTADIQQMMKEIERG